MVTVRNPQKVKALQATAARKRPVGPFREAMVDAGLFHWHVLPMDLRAHITEHVRKLFEDDKWLDSAYMMVSGWGGSSDARKYRVITVLAAFEAIADWMETQ